MNNEFPINSRYHGISTAEHVDPNGRKRVYLKRRFLPSTSAGQQIAEHIVREHERLDHIAHQHFLDSTLFWRLCDANEAVDPDDLLVPLNEKPRRLKITLPEGVDV